MSVAAGTKVVPGSVPSGASEPPRLAIVVSHPIQYFSPLYRAIAANQTVDLKVFFCSRIGLDAFHDPRMGVEFGWKTDLLGGYVSSFLDSASNVKSLDWRSFDNRDIGPALAAFDPNAVIIHGYSSKTLLRAMLWARRRGVPTMLVADSSTDTSRSTAVRKLKRVVLPMLLKRYDTILTMSERGEAYFKSYGVPSDRLFRVPTMMDENFWRARDHRQAERDHLRASLEIPASAFVVLAVGKIYPTKRVGDIVEALQRLHHPAVHLLVVGDGQDRREVEQQARLAKLNATFAGFVNIDKLASYYASADCLVHAASLEQFGMVAIEAAILGLPMILSDRIGAIGATSIAPVSYTHLTLPTNREV